MWPTKDLLIRVIRQRARRRAGELACALIRARPEAREMVLAELQFQQWLQESCRQCEMGP